MLSSDLTDNCDLMLLVAQRKSVSATSLEPAYVSLYGKKGFTDMIKYRISRRGRLLWVIHIDPNCHHKGPYGRKSGKSREEGSHVMKEAGGESDAAPVRGR